MATNVPSIEFTDEGLAAPDENQILEGELADIDDSFGGGVDLDLTTPQGQLAQSMTAIIGDKNDQILYVANNIDPDRASGRWQDAIGRIYFLERIAATGTVVTGRCYGLVGTVLPSGTAAQDTNGYIYYSTSSATISADGYVDVEFQNSTLGPIACPIGNLSKIYIRVQGWDSVDNLTAGTIGQNVESRADFEARRRASAAINATNTPGAIQANVLSVSGVVDAYVIDNPLGTAVDVGATSFSVAANSVYVCVSGGTDEDIAYAIWGRKSLGCNYNGDRSFVVEDSDGYEQPYPQYTVRWQEAVATPTYFDVTIADDPALPADIDTRIKNAIIAAFNGQDGGSRARIGSTIYAGRYYAGVSGTSPRVNIQSITLDKSAAADHPAGRY